MADNDVEIQFGADTAGAEEGAERVKASMQGLGDSVEGITEKFQEMGAMLLAAFSVEGIKSMIESMAELGEKTERTMAILGISSKQVGDLNYMAQSTGGNVDGMAMAMERLQRGLAQAQAGTGPVAQALNAMGLSAKNLMALPIPEQVALIADKFKQWADGGTKTALAMDLFGRSGAAMIPVLDKGREGIEELSAAGESFGAEMTPRMVEGLSNVQHQVVNLETAMTSLKASLVSTFGTSIATALNGLATLVANISATINAGHFWETQLESLRYALESLIMDFADFGRAALAAFSLDWSGVKGAWQDHLEDQENVLKAHYDRLGAIILKSKMQLQDQMASVGEGGGKQQAPAMSATGDAGAAEKDADAQIKVWEQWLTQRKTIYDADQKMGEISEQAKFKLVEDATEKAYQSELGLLYKEAELGNLSVAQQSAIYDKIKELKAKHDTDMVKLDEQALEASQKQWQGYFTSIESAFNGQLRGLLAGTENWKQASQKVLADFVVDFIEAVEKMLGIFVSAELAKTAASTSGAAARQAVETASQSGGLVAIIANAIKSISADGGKTAAAVTANVAPVAGPAAPAIGAAAGAATIAEGMALVPHAVGSWEVPGITPALLHPGEMVIPQTFAEGLRANGGLGGGGGDTNTVNINAIDSQSITNMFQGNSALIGSIVQKYVKNNPSSVRAMG